MYKFKITWVNNGRISISVLNILSILNNIVQKTKSWISWIDLTCCTLVCCDCDGDFFGGCKQNKSTKVFVFFPREMGKDYLILICPGRTLCVKLQVFNPIGLFIYLIYCAQN